MMPKRVKSAKRKTFIGISKKTIKVGPNRKALFLLFSSIFSAIDDEKLSSPEPPKTSGQRSMSHKYVFLEDGIERKKRQNKGIIREIHLIAS